MTLFPFQQLDWKIERGWIMFFDREDICEAWFLFLSRNHEGQWSDKYRRLSKLMRFYRPRPGLNEFTLSLNGKEIYNALEKS